MASIALTNFNSRLAEIDQLLDAHGALVRLERATDALQQVGGNLANIGAVVNHLVTDPGPGRPKQVQALNKAAIALLSGHLQGFVTDLYKEAAEALLEDRVASVAAVTDSGPTRGNPTINNITKLFASLGFADVLDGLSWQGFSNQKVRTRLTTFNRLRNNVVHGNSTSVTKDDVRTYLDSWRVFGGRLERKLRADIRAVTGHNPW